MPTITSVEASSRISRARRGTSKLPSSLMSNSITEMTRVFGPYEEDRGGQLARGRDEHQQPGARAGCASASGASTRRIASSRPPPRMRTASSISGLMLRIAALGVGVADRQEARGEGEDQDRARCRRAPAAAAHRRHRSRSPARCPGSRTAPWHRKPSTPLHGTSRRADDIGDRERQRRWRRRRPRRRHRVKVLITDCCRRSSARTAGSGSSAA